MSSADSSSLIAGAIAGTTTDLLLHPLDTIKTRLQDPRGFRASGGFSRLFSGVTPAFVGSAPCGAVFFSVYDFMMSDCVLGTESAFRSSDDRQHQPNVASTLARSWIASSVAESSACVVRAPLDVIRQNLQVAQHTHSGAGNSSTGGIASLFKRVSPSKIGRVYVALLHRELPFAGLQLPVLEFVRHNRFVRERAAAHAPKWMDERTAATCVAGFVAGSFAGFCTTPLDVIKTRLALIDREDVVAREQSNQASGAASVKRTSVLRAAHDIFRARGVSGLFAGAIPRVTMIGCGGTIFFGSFELAKSWLHRRKQHSV